MFGRTRNSNASLADGHSKEEKKNGSRAQTESEGSNGDGTRDYEIREMEQGVAQTTARRERSSIQKKEVRNYRDEKRSWPVGGGPVIYRGGKEKNTAGPQQKRFLARGIRKEEDQPRRLQGGFRYCLGEKKSN